MLKVSKRGGEVEMKKEIITDLFELIPRIAPSFLTNYQAKILKDTFKDFTIVVRCKDCKHRPKEPNWETYESGFDIEFPNGSKCPCRCSGDEYYSWYPNDDWFCADGERR